MFKTISKAISDAISIVNTETVLMSEPEEDRFKGAQKCFRALAKMPGFNTLPLEQLRKIALVSVYCENDQSLNVLSPDDMQILDRQSHRTNMQSKELSTYSNTMVINDIITSLHVNDTIQKLIISRNDLGNNEAKAIALMLKANHTIVSLDLCLNNIGSEGCIAILEALCKRNKALKSISLTRNPIDIETIRFLSLALANNELILEKLDLHDNKYSKEPKISIEGLNLLASGIIANHSLKNINLSGIGLNREGFFSIFLSILKAGSTLQKIDISDNDLKFQEIYELFTVLQANPGNITSINLIYSRLTKKDIQTLCNEFPVTSTECELLFDKKIKIQVEFDFSKAIWSDLVLRSRRVTRPKGSGELTL